MEMKDGTGTTIAYMHAETGRCGQPQRRHRLELEGRADTRSCAPPPAVLSSAPSTRAPLQGKLKGKLKRKYEDECKKVRQRELNAEDAAVEEASKASAASPRCGS